MIQIVLRRPRGMVGMRMIEPKQLAAKLSRALLGHAGMVTPVPVIIPVLGSWKVIALPVVSLRTLSTWFGY